MMRRVIVGYTYEVVMDGTVIREGGDWDIYDTEEEAMEAGEAEIDDIIAYEEGYNEGDRDSLSISIIDVEEEEEEEE